ncbi:hypothetical protein [Methylobacterium durans]|uniref:hypothetical protein n=1 Tax=Methylobacterium durans TaxID=2202825 RepID=UPI0013A553D9|nr:hypothetical protein [Methylobacterium durans]
MSHALSAISSLHTPVQTIVELLRCCNVAEITSTMYAGSGTLSESEWASLGLRDRILFDTQNATDDDQIAREIERGVSQRLSVLRFPQTAGAAQIRRALSDGSSSRISPSEVDTIFRSRIHLDEAAVRLLRNNYHNEVDSGGGDNAPLRALSALSVGSALSFTKFASRAAAESGTRRLLPGSKVAIVTFRRVPFPPSNGADARVLANVRCLQYCGFSVVLFCEVRPQDLDSATFQATRLSREYGVLVDVAALSKEEAAVSTAPSDSGEINWAAFQRSSSTIRFIRLMEQFSPDFVVVNFVQHMHFGVIAQSYGSKCVLDTHDFTSVREGILSRLQSRFGMSPMAYNGDAIFQLDAYVYQGGQI